MSPLYGIGLKVTSVLLFLVMQSLIKATADHVPPGQAVFFRSFFAMPVILIWLMMRHELSTGLKTSRPMGHFWRGLVGTISMFLGFAAVAYLPLAEATAIGYAAPLMIVILAALFLGERVRAFRISTVIVGLIGVLIVLWPNLSTVGSANSTLALGATLALLAALFSAFAQIAVSKLTTTEGTASIVFWFSMSATLLSFLTLPTWVIPAWHHAALLVMAGILGGIAQIFMTSAYRYADASLVAPFEYVSMIFAILIGLFIFGDLPTWQSLLGGAIIISAGIVIILRERYLGQKRTQMRKAKTPI